MDTKERALIQRAIEIDGYIPSCYKRNESIEDMWTSVAIMTNCKLLLESENNNEDMIRIIRDNGIPISLKITDFLNERSEDNKERAYIYMCGVLRSDTYELIHPEHVVSYEITRDMYNYAIEVERKHHK